MSQPLSQLSVIMSSQEGTLHTLHTAEAQLAVTVLLLESPYHLQMHILQCFAAGGAMTRAMAGLLHPISYLTRASGTRTVGGSGTLLLLFWRSLWE